jgi:hypothetical protein
MRKLTLTIFFAFSCALALWAQPSNDECSNPIVINNLSEFCSQNGAYTNVAATTSFPLQSPAGCWGGTSAQKDVWFSFKALATSVDISITGATSLSPGGTLHNPQVALYLGDCNSAGGISEVRCASDNTGNNSINLYEAGLYVGSNYLIRVQGQGGKSGTFKLCLNNYNEPAASTSDCPTASRLCDKSPFTVQKVSGAGNDNTELNDAACFNGGTGGNFETNSSWFVWTCDQSGTLEFTLTPQNPSDDLDFVLYRLPNGVGDCSNKAVLRCMASGDTQGQTAAQNAPCEGATGLVNGESDVSAPPGCQPGENAWLKPLDMVSGETYALVVNNYDTHDHGFSISFGGTGTFLGPKADFNTIPAAVCLGTPVQVVDASTFSIGNITQWQWSFGANAQPQTAAGQGPHNVQFNTPGVQSVVMTIKTNLGCQVTAIKNVLVFPDVQVDTIIAAPDCNGGTNGAITIANIKMGTPPYQFSWNGGPFSSSDSLTHLAVGTYQLEIRDSNNCKTDLNIPVAEKTLKVKPDVTKPLCFGDTNGVITLNVLNGTPPYLFSWPGGPGFIPNNTETGFAAGMYTILGKDSALCKGTFLVTVTDNPVLTLKMDTINVSCFGAGDGMGIAKPEGGVGNYTYLWSDGQTTAKASNLQPGTYTVTVSDGNECNIIGTVSITQPPDVNIALVRVKDLVCNGVPQGEIVVMGSGGLMPYQFSADGVKYIPSDSLTGLPAGTYFVKIKDGNGCLDSVQATIAQPPALQVVALPSDTTLELGYTVHILTNVSPDGRPVTYEWTPSNGLGCDGCPNPLVIPDPITTAIAEMAYVIKVTDETNCVAFDTVRIHVKKDRPVYFPNIFAPEDNYPNDHFTGFSGPAADNMVLLRVYDRWGSLVFETANVPLNKPELGWNGLYKGQKVFGVFTWYALVHFVDQEQLEYEGSVTVLR